MLQRLLIRDFVIVDRLELEFDAGFGALTGETGAGKSILVDALSLALGERADAAVVRNGAERAEISAEFDVTPGGSREAWLRAGDEIDSTVPHFSSMFYGDFPCVFWPNARADNTRPAPLTADGIPTLVLGAIADPATPVSNGQDVFSRLSDGYLVTQDGGPHVIYGRGISCIDDLVTNFLVKDEMPANHETTCEGSVTWELLSARILLLGSGNAHLGWMSVWRNLIF